MDVLKQIPGYDPWRDAGSCVFDARAARQALDFFPEVLRHIEGRHAGQPFVLMPWQQAVVGNAFGWKRADGTRRYREVFLFVPRKNGKTPLAAGIALYLLCCDGEPGAQVYSAAADREQAALTYRHAVGMVAQEPALSSRLEIIKTTKAIMHPASGSIYKALSADADTKHGLNVSGALVDELHAHPKPDLTQVLKTGTASRRQPMVWYTTTSDYERESICNTTYSYAVKVRDGVIRDASFLPVIYEASPDADWTDPAVWTAANPNLGVSVNLDYMEAECRRAQEEPSYQNTFKRLHLNIRTNADVAWLDMRQWDACGAAFDPESLVGERCHGGLDLSRTTDLTAFCLWFPERERALWWYWIPRATAYKAEMRDRVPYAAWASSGHIEFTEGNVVDYDVVSARVLALCRMYRPSDVGYDPWNAMQTALWLGGQGVSMVEMRQGYRSLSEPSKELERLVVSGRFGHGGHPVTKWCASNVMVETDPAGNIKPSKAKSTGRIDGVVAAVIAMGRAIAEPPKPRSVYETRGVLTV